MTSNEYRALEAVNQSRLKNILKHPKLYATAEDSVTKSYLTFGQLAEDVLLMSSEEVDNKYAICNLEMPSEKIQEIIKNLYLARGTADFDTLKPSLVEEFRQVNGFQPRWKAETAYNKIKEQGADYLAFLGGPAKGKTVVSQEDMDRAQHLAVQVERNPDLAIYLSSDNLFKHVITFEHEGFDCKAELDIVNIDHENKTVQVVDVKTTAQFLGFKYAILKYRYDFQVSFYSLALAKTIEDLVGPGYKILDPVLLVLDSNGFFEPEIYTIPINFDPFEVNGKTYYGVKSAFERLAYHTENDEWNYTMEYIKSGNTHEFEI